MSSFRLFIHLGNAAMETAPDVADALRKIANDIERADLPSHYRTVFDANGNDVGRYAVKED